MRQLTKIAAEEEDEKNRKKLNEGIKNHVVKGGGFRREKLEFFGSSRPAHLKM